MADKLIVIGLQATDRIIFLLHLEGMQSEIECFNDSEQLGYEIFSVCLLLSVIEFFDGDVRGIAATVDLCKLEIENELRKFGLRCYANHVAKFHRGSLQITDHHSYH